MQPTARRLSLVDNLSSFIFLRLAGTEHQHPTSTRTMTTTVFAATTSATVPPGYPVSELQMSADGLAQETNPAAQIYVDDNTSSSAADESPSPVSLETIISFNDHAHQQRQQQQQRYPPNTMTFPNYLHHEHMQSSMQDIRLPPYYPMHNGIQRHASNLLTTPWPYYTSNPNQSISVQPEARAAPKNVAAPMIGSAIQNGKVSHPASAAAAMPTTIKTTSAQQRHKRTASAREYSPCPKSSPSLMHSRSPSTSAVAAVTSATSSNVTADPGQQKKLDHKQSSPSSTNPPQQQQQQRQIHENHRYRCDVCLKAFSRPSSLRVHMHSHTGEKPHLCPHPGCGKRFSVQSNMRRHLRVHYCNSFPDKPVNSSDPKNASLPKDPPIAPIVPLSPNDDDDSLV